MKSIVLLLLLFFSWSLAGADPIAIGEMVKTKMTPGDMIQTEMTQDKMESIVIRNVDILEQKKGYLVFSYKDVKMLLISDVKHDRMRIIAPILEYAKLTTEQKDIVLESNFHRALDARYASSNGMLYSAFIHPLSPLAEKELMAALNQVANLAKSFGSSYSSGTLSFGGG